MSFKINDRVRDRGGSRGTVKYIGTVATSTKNPDFVWIGVQWDDPSRGKHDGETGGVRYFRCDKNTSGSFAKPKKLTRAAGFLEMLQERYEEDDTKGNFKIKDGARSIEATFDGEEGRSFEVTLVGVEKIKKRQKLDVIERVSLESSNFGIAGENADRIGKMCPNLRELHAPETLIGCWSEIAKIVLQLPKLEILNLSRNRIAEFMSPKIEMSTFSNLRALILNRTGISWTQVSKLERAIPKLERLHICGNDLRLLGLQKEEKEDTKKFENLKMLDLSENDVEWKEVYDFTSSLPKLECLILNDTKIDRVELYDVNKSSSFSNLRSLSLCGGKIHSWSTVDELNRFPVLVSLKCSRQPELLKSLGPRQQRQQLVARVAGLLQLNSSDVRRRERDDAEKIYLHVVLSDAVSSDKSSSSGSKKTMNHDDNLWPEELQKMLSISTRQSLLSQHPRLLELLRRHGLPPSLRSKSSGDAKMQGMVSLILRSMATVSISKEPRTQRVPLRMKVGDLKRLCARFFKVPQSQQRLKYREADDFSVPEELDDDKSVLAYYGVADGGTIFIHDDGDRK